MAAAQDRRVALITGAGSGIGAASARRLAAGGLDLVLHTGQRADRLAETAAACSGVGATVATATGDLGDPALPAALVRLAEGRFGRLDVLISNAGFADRTPVGALDDAAVARSFEVITAAFLRLAAAALPLLRASPSPRVVAVSSFVAHRFDLGGVVMPASAAAKGGLEAAAASFAAQVAEAGITVNCVVPGYTRKDAGAGAALDQAAWDAAARRVPMRRLGRPDEVAAAIAFLAAPEAGYITGQRLCVDGGLAL